jgi:hypothetical protein
MINILDMFSDGYERMRTYARIVLNSSQTQETP